MINLFKRSVICFINLFNFKVVYKIKFLNRYLNEKFSFNITLYIYKINWLFIFPTEKTE